MTGADQTPSEADQRAAHQSIREARNEQRLAAQRGSFAAIAQAVEKAGFWKAAREIRREGDAAVRRMAETLDELETLRAENARLSQDLAKVTA